MMSQPEGVNGDTEVSKKPKLRVSKRIQKSRKLNFTDFERSLIVELIIPYKDTVESRKNDVATMTAKTTAWDAIVAQFNRDAGVRLPRDARQLKKCWENLRNKTRRSDSRRDVDSRPDTLGLIAENMARVIQEKSYIRGALANDGARELSENESGEVKTELGSGVTSDDSSGDDDRCSVELTPPHGDSGPPRGQRAEWQEKLRGFRLKQLRAELKCMKREHAQRMGVLRKQRNMLVKLNASLTDGSELSLRLIDMCSPIS